MLEEGSYEQFLDELDTFEDWMDSLQLKNTDIEGEIISVKPALVKTIENNNSRLNLNGYFLHFNDAFIETTHWEDHCYAFIFPDMQKRFEFAAGDRIEFRARVGLDWGRLVFNKINSVQMLNRSGNQSWSNSEALVARHTIVTHHKQRTKCLHCQFGILVDVVDKSLPRWKRSRELMCLKSVNDPEVCVYHVFENLIEQQEWCGE